MSISELQTMLRDLGLAGARTRLKARASRVAMDERLEIDDALRALSVLAGNYDDSVRDGRKTYSVDGVMPPLTSAAHEVRRAAL